MGESTKKDLTYLMQKFQERSCLTNKLESFRRLFENSVQRLVLESGENGQERFLKLSIKTSKEISNVIFGMPDFWG